MPRRPANVLDTQNGRQRVAAPFLKWPGGKRWLAPFMTRLIEPHLRGRYIEPFLGGGAIFLAMSPCKARLSDVNDQLISCYEVVRDDPERLIQAVWRFSNSRACYYRVRASAPRGKIGAAARFIYLNRTCWGGIYRVNRRAEFNTPFGDSGRVICSGGNLRKCAGALKTAVLRSGDFEEAVEEASAGDVVYADPPYVTRQGVERFLRYNDAVFRWQDQKRLAESAQGAAGRGALVVVSAPADWQIAGLYRGWWCLEVTRQCSVARSVRDRKPVRELLLFSHKPEGGVPEVDCAGAGLGIRLRVAGGGPGR